ncbi:MAG TPA: cardiolipin synthase [Verrucomicrobiae bacterium]|nr:cardiolipin synthase [Verrucomicrobiae bacterium]
MNPPSYLLAIGIVIEIAVLVRVMLRPHREPASRIAWLAVILALPMIGVVAYMLFGEVNIGRRRLEKLRAVERSMPPPESGAAEQLNLRAQIPERYEALFRVGHSISGFEPVAGNSARLMADSNAAITAMVADINAAKEHVHVLFYIWLTDGNGNRIADALKRAAARGVQCRAMVDGLGSRALLKSDMWRAIQSAGVKTGVALALNHPLLRVPFRRIDLRNHRKIVVIDNGITYCGSQNCADPEFRVKAKFAPWVDVMMRFEGPIARQNQRLFACDWMSATNENLDNLLRLPWPSASPGFPAQVIGTGPTARFSAMPETFESLIYAARRELMITTPYYVPDESLQNALCSAAQRGVKTTIIFPARNDSWIVAGASRSYYADLLAAGVEIHEYVGGLLHAKTLTLDGEITLIGSANMDRRSFELNYENNILLYDAELTGALHDRQREFLARSRPVTRAAVETWPLPRKFWNNTLAMLGPIL